jgi:spore coat polysaccharide biosynthesis predicted glycosyltransferase SpsG|tara:strand:+ start:2175 stop:2390 length:216 start_codon:yes stop_codon:yes gene_type:complete
MTKEIHTLFGLLEDLTEKEEKEILLRSKWLGATDQQRMMTNKIIDHLKATPYDLSVLLPVYAIILKSSKKL